MRIFKVRIQGGLALYLPDLNLLASIQGYKEQRTSDGSVFLAPDGSIASLKWGVKELYQEKYDYVCECECSSSVWPSIEQIKALAEPC